MTVSEDTVGTFGRARLTFASDAEIEEFVAMLERFEKGEISADAWRQFRLVRGTYGQRQADDAQMLRVKIPQGVLTSAQLDALADVGERWSRGFGHITTRQNVQFHFVKLHDVEPAMRRLAVAGLTTREACGNSVRNITTCPLAGVAADEAFDVTPYAEALTRYLLRHPLSSTLPRKFKIAFEGCEEDHIATPINDLGFRAIRGQDDAPTFRVLAGGGTSTMARSASVLHEELPARDLLRVSEAVLRVFHRLGDYQHKQRNRMKFLIRSLGWERWRAEYERELDACRDSVPDLAVVVHPELAPSRRWGGDPSVGDIAACASTSVRGPGLAPVVTPILGSSDEAFQAWRASNVRRQKQDRFVTATITLPLGDLTSGQMRVAGRLAETYGDGTVRTTIDQNLLLRWVPAVDLRAVYRRLAGAGLGRPGAGTLADVASCPGAESCRLAVTQSRALARLLEERLDALADVSGAASARIKISGCPNGCGQHHLAAIGFQGSVRRLNGGAIPQYFVLVGGGVDGDRAHFGRLVAKVPARRIPLAVERLIALYAAERAPGEPADAFFRRIEPAVVSGALTDLASLAPGEAAPEDFVDLGEDAAYAPEVLDGECSA